METNWISVKDGLPEDRDDILFVVHDEVHKGYYNSLKGWLYEFPAGEYPVFELSEVTHWMPLPPAPETESV